MLLGLMLCSKLGLFLWLSFRISAEALKFGMFFGFALGLFCACCLVRRPKLSGFRVSAEALMCCMFLVSRLGFFVLVV